MVEALVGTHKVSAILDTGAQRTLGNLALYAKLGLRPTDSYRDTIAEVIGATDSDRAESGTCCVRSAWASCG